MLRIIDDRYLTTGLFPASEKEEIRQGKELLNDFLSAYIKQYFKSPFQISQVKKTSSGIKGVFLEFGRPYTFSVSRTGSFKYVEGKQTSRLDARKKKCRTGKSCGNTCITKGKVCQGKLKNFNLQDFELVRSEIREGNKAWANLGIAILSIYATKKLAQHLAYKQLDRDVNRKLAIKKQQKQKINKRALEKKIRTAESRIRDNNFETLILFDPKNGKQIGNFKGDKRKVQVQKYEDSLKLAGSVATHNHPVDVSLSAQDIKSAMYFQTDQMRVVTNKHRYVLKPPKEGWNRQFHDRIWQKEYKKQYRIQVKKYRQLFWRGEISLDDANHKCVDDIIRSTAEATGVSYNKQKYRDRIVITTGGRYAA